jgi:hypothetical protein
MSSSTTAIVVASISAVVSLASAAGLELLRRRSNAQAADAARDLETFKHELTTSHERETKDEAALELVSRYRDPLLRSAFDLQSRIYNILEGGFSHRQDPEYFRLNTLFVVAEFFGWLEIIRRELQFLDLGATGDTRELNVQLDRIRGDFATSRRWPNDPYYVYRGQQRAIGELMLSELGGDLRGRPRHQCIGYARFVAMQDDPGFARWFERLGKAIVDLPGTKPKRLVSVQRALVDLIDFLDPHDERFQRGRSKIPPTD